MTVRAVLPAPPTQDTLPVPSNKPPFDPWLCPRVGRGAHDLTGGLAQSWGVDTVWGGLTRHPRCLSCVQGHCKVCECMNYQGGLLRFQCVCMCVFVHVYMCVHVCALQYAPVQALSSQTPPTLTPGPREKPIKSTECNPKSGGPPFQGETAPSWAWPCSGHPTVQQ